MVVNFGYVMNRGATKRQNIYDELLHDDIKLELEVQMSDHQDTDNTKTNDIYMAVKIGDVIVVSKSFTLRGRLHGQILAEKEQLFLLFFKVQLPAGEENIFTKKLPLSRIFFFLL